MDRLRAMTVFVAVIESGSLSAAARRLGEPLTNVSRALSQLEAQLGCTLVDRSTRRMALTPAGSDYLQTCKDVLEILEGTARKIAGQSGEPSGNLAITAPVKLGHMHVLPIVSEFLATYPRINARLLLVDRVVDLMEEGIDVALRVGELPDSALIATRVATLRLVTCASPAYLERRGSPKEPSALDQHDCVTFADLPGGLRWVFKSQRHGRKSVRVRSRLSVNAADAAVSAAVAGVGITRVLSYQVQQALQDGSLRVILRPFDDTAIPVHLVYRPAHTDSPRVRAFVEFAAYRLRTPKATI